MKCVKVYGPAARSVEMYLRPSDHGWIFDDLTFQICRCYSQESWITVTRRSQTGRGISELWFTIIYEMKVETICPDSCRAYIMHNSHYQCIQAEGSKHYILFGGRLFVDTLRLANFGSLCLHISSHELPDSQFNRSRSFTC